MKIVSLIMLLFLQGQMLLGQVDYAKPIVEKLASKKFAGRGYVFGGDKKAASFIAREFRKNGVLPLKGHYFQPFAMDANVFPKEVKVTLDNKKLSVGVNTLIEASSPSLRGRFDISKVSLQKDTLFLRQLMNNPAYSGKIIFVDEAVALENMKADEFRMSLLYLAQGGLYKGILVDTKQKLLWRGATRQIQRPIVYVKDVVTEGLAVKELDLNIYAKYQKDYKTNNVCGYIKGTSGSDSTVVITAHYDHVGAIGRNIIFPGANDNASGTALLLYLTKYYNAHPPKYNMVFLAFSGEESGLLGSIHFANNSQIDLSKIKFLLNFDMAGTGDDGIQVVNGTVSKTEFDRLVQINKEKSYLPQVLVRGPMNRSDHYPFYEKGVPSFFLYTLGGIGAYHDVYDRFETLPFTKFDAYTQLMIDFITTL